MSGQLIVVILLVAFAFAFMARDMMKSLRKGGCGTGCRKCGKPVEEERRPGTIPLKQVER
jgi:hypothetical protein